MLDIDKVRDQVSLFDRLAAPAAEVQIVNPFLPGFPAQTFTAGGIDQSSLGAFRLRTHWTLSVPIPYR